MVRLLSAIILIAFVAAAASSLLTGIGSDQASERQLALAAGVALALASVAALAALAAYWRANALAGEVRRLAAAVDSALRANPAAQGSASAAPIRADTIVPAASVLAMAPEMEDAAPSSADARAGTSNNVVQLAARKGVHRRKKAAAPLPGNLASQTDAVELSLQPIISATTGRTAGFDVFRSLHDGDTFRDLRTSTGAPDGIEKATFERETLEAAIRAGRRRTGASADNPLYVAISEALLHSPDELTSLLKLVNSYPVVAEIIVICIEADRLTAKSATSKAIARLTQAGFRLALCLDEDISPPGLSSPALSCVRISAARLMQADHEDVAALVKQVADRQARFVATNVESESEAVALLDRGVDLMIGGHFCEPRRLKPEASAEAAR
ncbi:MAG: EAL domain-containing protein [Rhizobiaceae bacterium]|nr:EAL domain-containing protein [Rhizobiaceae bacterium]